jgi:hypothetical protein
VETSSSLSADDRGKLVAAYARLAVAHGAEDEWAWGAMHDHIWWKTAPEQMLEVVIEVVNRLPGNVGALGYVGAGPLEDLLGGYDTVMRRAAEEAATNPDFRSALAVVYGVRYAASGYEQLHDLVRTEIDRLDPPNRTRGAAPT